MNLFNKQIKTDEKVLNFCFFKTIIKKQQIRSSEEKDREKFLNLLNLAIDHYYIEISSYNFVIKSIKYDLFDCVLVQGK